MICPAIVAFKFIMFIVVTFHVMTVKIKATKVSKDFDRNFVA